jgi:alanine dehydrogenase
MSSESTLLLLTPNDVRSLLTLDECIRAVEMAFRLHGEGKTVPPGVLGLHTHAGGFHIKAGLLDLGHSYFAAKVNGNYPQNSEQVGLPTIQGVIVLCDAENGSPLAVMDSREITTLRTAAATAVAAKFLARPDSSVVTICGCGTQGLAQLRALSRVCPMESVFAYDKDTERASALAQRLAPELQIPVTVADNLPAAVRQSDVCVTCTTSQRALLGPDDIREGTFIAAVGADNPQKQELDPLLMAKSKVVCDIIDQCAVMGDLHHALRANAVRRNDVHAELGQIVARKKPGRQCGDEITIFDSTGMALQDVAAAAIVFEKAVQQGAGIHFSFAA